MITGTGNKMDDINIDINNKSIIIIDPEQPINTKEAYKNILPSKPKYQLIDKGKIINNKKNKITEKIFKQMVNDLNIKHYSDDDEKYNYKIINNKKIKEGDCITKHYEYRNNELKHVGE